MARVAVSRFPSDSSRRANQTSVSIRKPFHPLTSQPRSRRPHFPHLGRIALCLSILLTVGHGVARGAAIELYETGAPTSGPLALGGPRWLPDASTAAANPAGMTQLERTQLLSASGALLPSTNFDIGPKTTAARGTPLGFRGRQRRRVHAGGFVLLRLQVRRALAAGCRGLLGLWTGGQLQPSMGRPLLYRSGRSDLRQDCPLGGLPGERLAVVRRWIQLRGCASHLQIKG